MARKQTVASLKKKLWPFFSLYIRKRDKGICFTCDRKGELSAMNAGHFIPRGGHNATFFDEINVNCQCVYCNLWQHGNLHEYSARLIAKYGLKEFEELIKRGRSVKQFTIQELEAMIEKYKKLLQKFN